MGSVFTCWVANYFLSKAIFGNRKILLGNNKGGKDFSSITFSLPLFQSVEGPPTESDFFPLTFHYQKTCSWQLHRCCCFNHSAFHCAYKCIPEALVSGDMLESNISPKRLRRTLEKVHNNMLPCLGNWILIVLTNTVGLWLRPTIASLGAIAQPNLSPSPPNDFCGKNRKRECHASYLQFLEEIKWRKCLFESQMIAQLEAQK